MQLPRQVNVRMSHIVYRHLASSIHPLYQESLMPFDKTLDEGKTFHLYIQLHFRIYPNLCLGPIYLQYLVPLLYKCLRFLLKCKTKACQVLTKETCLKQLTQNQLYLSLYIFHKSFI